MSTLLESGKREAAKHCHMTRIDPPILGEFRVDCADPFLTIYLYRGLFDDRKRPDGLFVEVRPKAEAVLEVSQNICGGSVASEGIVSLQDDIMSEVTADEDMVRP